MTEVRFCSTPDGVRLAYQIHGRGPMLVRVGTWLTHLELDWESPVWRHWLDRLGETHTVLRYDERGCGLSDPEVGEPSVETWVGDLETVVDAAGWRRFVLLGVSQGAAIAVEYAARHPDRIADLVLYGGFTRGRLARGQVEQQEALVASIRAGWSAEDPAFRRVFSMLFLPDGTPAQMAWYEELMRTTTTAEAAALLYSARGAVDVVSAAPSVTARTLVIHARRDHVVPIEEGRLLARLIPEARFVVVDSPNHILLAHEPAWERFLSTLREFLGTPETPTPPRTVSDLSSRELVGRESPHWDALTPSERRVALLTCQGLRNEELAKTLFLSPKTIEKHLGQIYRKLGLRSRTELTSFVLRSGNFDNG